MVRTEQDYIILPGGVHVWGPPEEFLGAVPDEVVTQESAGQTIHQLETIGWRMLESKTVVVTGDVPEEALRVLAVTAEEINKMLIRELGGRPAPKNRYRVRVFDKREDFCRYAAACGGPNANSLYDPRVQEMALNFSPTTDQEEFQEIFAHEFTHAYMDKVYKVTEPLWFAEGMAEYFSLLKWTRLGYKPTGGNWRAPIHIDLDNLIPLSDILKSARIDMYGVTYQQYYAQAWAAVHFLLKKHPDVIEGLLKKEIFILDLLSDEYARHVRKTIG